VGERLKQMGLVLLAVVLVAVVAFYAWTRIARYPAFEEAATIAEQARTAQGWYVFEPDGEPTAGLVFYPGGLVDPAAYAPLMRRLSGGGILAVIVPMPLDLAVLGIHRADDVFSAYPGIETWMIGGHSLGGAMAAEYVSGAPDSVEGVIFLAAYPAESTDLSAIPTRVLSIYGTEDLVAGDGVATSLPRLPADTRLEVIEGGNHAQFGDYGPQKGDGTATISREEQQQLTAEAILRFAGAE